MKQYEQPFDTTAVSDDDNNDDNDDNNNNGSTITSDSENVIDYQQLTFEKEYSYFA